VNPARSIANLEQLGLNADREFTYWNDWALKENRRDPKSQDRARRGARAPQVSIGTSA